MATPDLTASDFGPVPSQEAFRLAFLNPYPQIAYWQAVQTAVEDRAKADAVTVDVFTLDSPSALEQIDQITDVIAQGYDGILLGAVDPIGVVPGIVAANEAGIPVLAVDTRPEAGEILSLVQVDNVAAARSAGEFIADAIGGEGVVLNLQGDMDGEVAQDRDEGLRAAVDPFDGIEIVSERANWGRDLAATRMKLHIPGSGGGTPVVDPGLSAVFAANDAMALGAVDALKEAGQEDVVIVGFGGAPEAITAIATGDLSATVALLPTRVGAIAVDLMVRHLNGQTVPPRVNPGFVLVIAVPVNPFT